MVINSGKGSVWHLAISNKLTTLLIGVVTFQWTGEKFILYPLQLRLKLKSENFNIRF